VGAGDWGLGIGRVQGSRFRVQGSRFKVQGAGFKVQGSRCRVRSGFEIRMVSSAKGEAGRGKSERDVKRLAHSR